MPPLSRQFPLALLVLLAFAAVWSWWGAHDSVVWWAEMASVFGLVLVLGATFRLFRFSSISYAVLALWALLQIIGAHYTFELVPFDAVTDFFGFERNHFDRVAHFCIGMSSYVMAEFAWRRSWVRSVALGALLGVLGVMALANAWEIAEWLYAEWDGGEAGQAFLGSQGDIWDAQKDMLMDSLGGIVGALLFLISGKNPPKQG